MTRIFSSVSYMADNVSSKIIEIIKTHVNPKQGLANLSKNQNIAPAISDIVKQKASEAPKVIANAPPDDVVRAISSALQKGVKLPPLVAAAALTPMIRANAPAAATAQVVQAAPPDDVVRAISSALQKGVKLPPLVAAAALTPMIRANAPAAATAQVVQAAPPDDVVRAISSAVKNGVVIPTEVLNAAVKKKPGFFQKFINLFRPKNSMNRPNFISPTQTGVNNQGRPTYNQKPPFPGYVLATNPNQNGRLKTGWYKNKGPAPPAPVPAPPPVPVPASQVPRNYTKMSIRELLEALRKDPDQRPIIADILRKAVEKELRDLRYEYSRARRTRKLGDLLRLLPRNYTGRRDASSMVVNDVRETRNNRELSNVRSNLGNVPNENIRRALENQRRRFQRKKNDSVQGSNDVRRRRSTQESNELRRRRVVFGSAGESNELRRRRAVLGSAGESNELRRRRAVQESNESGPRRAVNEGEPRRSMNDVPLPVNQQQAINKVGGVNKAMNTVMNVPGGAIEISKATEALNETKGNANLAIQIKGASPEAIKAVQNLGGPKNTMVVLEGLNTLSRKTPAPQKRTSQKRRKTYRPRIAELNRVINAVKKQKLISLVAHNVLKTHNIHPNDEKMKKYYKKVLKANILRTPFAKVVRKAARQP